MDASELLWKQYQQNVDLYKFYMDLTIKFNVFFYAVTGAIISFALTEHNGNELIRYSLLLPLVMSLCFSGFFVYGGVLMRVLRQETFSIRDTLKLQAAPDVGGSMPFCVELDNLKDTDAPIHQPAAMLVAAD